MTHPFIHLHLHTEYSIVDSIVKVKPLLQEVKNQHMPAVGVTDICNLFAMVKFYKTALDKGVKPIVGTEIWLETTDNAPFHKLVLLCQNKEGYQNLTQLISRGYQQGERLAVPLLKKTWLKEFNQGLIALSGAQWGDIGHTLIHHSPQQAASLLKEWQEIFPNRFYLELQRNQRDNEKEYEKQLLNLAKESACPIVATNEVVFLKQEDFAAHKARVCIQEGTTLELQQSTLYSSEQYFKSSDQMALLFQDLPSALANTLEIAKRCSLELMLDHTVLPTFPVPQGMTEKTYLQKAASDGLTQRLQAKFKKPSFVNAEQTVVTAHYEDRLNIELAVINTMNFPGYFLIVADFIQWAKSNKIPVGPGRGSGAGSLVAFALGITDLDPLDYDLLFERFLNPERVSMPDFDIDFCMDGRDRVIEYVANQYGRHSVSQIATFGTMAAKAVVRDVGRVLAYPYGFVDKIAKLIPFEIGMTLEKALQDEPTLQKRYVEEEEVKTLIDLAKKLEGMTRNVGKHAGGVVIAPSSLTDFAPLFCEKDSNQVVIQFDKDDVEAIGLTKFDFLGLRTLTIIDWAVQNANKLQQRKNLAPIDIESITLNDSATFALLKKCATTAVFQLESRGMKELIKRLQPDEFEEIIALVALFRPGPLQSGMVDDFINRKHKRQAVEYLHPAIEAILKPTYGVILYQEQVMQIAQTLAGYTLGGADLLRRAMGKKKPEEMAKQRTIFTTGAMQRGVDEKNATTIFDLMEKFAGYGFNKSHSAAYALVSYQTAWLKAHFPSSFMAAVLSADMSHTDKIMVMIEECRQCQIPVLPPDIHYSEYFFTVNTDEQIIYGLGAVKGVGEAAIAHIIEERQRRPFRDLFDFCERMDTRKVNRRVLESMIKSGTFDCFSQERSVLMAAVDEALHRAEQFSKNRVLGQTDLFQGMPQEEIRVLPKVLPWTVEERLQAEKESLGMYLSGHPLTSFENELSKMGVKKFKAINPSKKEAKLMIAGLIISIRTVQTKNGDRMGIVMLDDRFDRFEVAIFPDQYQTFRELLVKDQILIVEGTASIDNYSGGIRIKTQKLFTLMTAREQFARKIHIKIQAEQLSDSQIEKFKAHLAAHEPGNCAIHLEYHTQFSQILLKFGPQWQVKLAAPMLDTITQLMAPGTVEIEY